MNFYDFCPHPTCFGWDLYIYTGSGFYEKKIESCRSRSRSGSASLTLVTNIVKSGLKDFVSSQITEYIVKFVALRL